MSPPAIEAREAGAHALLRKPFSPLELIDLVERREFDLGVARLLRRDERVEGDDLHLEPARAARHDATDAPQAHDAQSLPAQLHADLEVATRDPK